MSRERAGDMMMEVQFDAWAGRLFARIPASELAAVTDALGCITNVVLRDMRYLQEGE